LSPELPNKKKTHPTGESLMSPAAVDIVEAMLGESCAKFYLQIILWEEEYRVFQKTFVIN
jgi:hypothetical protein